jgi:hypothetical protein
MARKVTAEEATARLSRARPDIQEWPSCEGVCIDGVCALRWGHPACCGIHRATYYEHIETAAGQQLGTDNPTSISSWDEGHWEGPEWFCWG